MSAARIVDRVALEHALDDIAGITTLLLDASRHQDPEQEGITAAARILEGIHTRLSRAVGLEAGR
jgi:hypothetical protein